MLTLPYTIAVLTGLQVYVRALSCSTHILLSKLFLQNQASAFVISNLKISANPSYVSTNASYYVSNITGRQVLDINLFIKKDINSKLMVIFELYKFNGRKKLKLWTMPKVNLCDLMRSAISAPVILDFVKESDSNLFRACPYKAGHYYLNQYPIQRPSGRKFLPRGLYYFLVEILHEDGKKASVCKLEVYMERK
jgi:Protein of unknown function (DUF1091)